jgi:hypothetical protein
MSDEHEIQAPEVIDFEVCWKNTDSPNGFYRGITGSARDGDFLRLTKGNESWLINLREVTAVKMTAAE